MSLQLHAQRHVEDRVVPPVEGLGASLERLLLGVLTTTRRMIQRTRILFNLAADSGKWPIALWSAAPSMVYTERYAAASAAMLLGWSRAAHPRPKGADLPAVLQRASIDNVHEAGGQSSQGGRPRLQPRGDLDLQLELRRLAQVPDL